MEDKHTPRRGIGGKMGDKTAADVLKEARDLIAKDGGWTQRQYARGADGTYADFYNKKAVCFCTLGALYRVGLSEPKALNDAEHLLLKSAQVENIVVWNDAPERTQAEVVALFDAALSKAGV
jgi:hypothetical protein